MAFTACSETQDEPVSIDSGEAATTETPSSPQKPAASIEPGEKKPLNLNLSEPPPRYSLTGEAGTTEQDDETGESGSRLPDMFGKEGEKTYQVKGSVIRDKEQEDFVESIEGAGVEIKRKIP